MSGTFASDISSYQVPVNDSYANPWLIFRACDGTWRDSNFAANLAWAKRACAAGKLYGYTVYAVYEPGADTLGTIKAMVGTPDGHLTVMIDVESWSGKIQGDHSADITALYRALAAWLGDERRVIAYGNQGDLASLYPHRPAAERLIVASYGSSKPTVPGQIGWQYSDGQPTYPVPAGYPRAAAPFGPSDQNHFDLDPAALAAALGVGEDVALDPNDPTVKKILDALGGEIWQAAHHYNSAFGIDLKASREFGLVLRWLSDNKAGIATDADVSGAVAKITAAAQPANAPLDVNALAAQIVADLGPDLASTFAQAVATHVTLAVK